MCTFSHMSTAYTVGQKFLVRHAHDDNRYPQVDAVYPLSVTRALILSGSLLLWQGLSDA